MKQVFEYISLFSGGGGLDLGFELAGWKCLYASDLDKFSVETLNHNKGRRIGRVKVLEDAVIEQADVRKVTGYSILQKIGRERGTVPLLIGGPPCQSWSSAGHQLGFEDPRGQLFKDYVRIAVETGVNWIVFENVRGLLTARGPDGKPGSALQHIRKELLDAGFQSEVELLNAADFGVPQRRVRLCLIGYRIGSKPPYPKQTHSKCADSSERTLKPWLTLQQAIGEIDPPVGDEVIRPTGALKDALATIEPGSGVKSPGKAETTRPGGHWGYKQGAFVADPTLPARTVTAGAQQDWIREGDSELRRLHPRECAALQTFPPEWIFSGRRIDQYRQIGNAVPVKLAVAIGKTLKTHLKSQESGSMMIPQDMTLAPLRDHLRSAIEYTISDQRKNGESRRLAPVKKRVRLLLEMVA